MQMVHIQLKFKCCKLAVFNLKMQLQTRALAAIMQSSKQSINQSIKQTTKLTNKQTNKQTNKLTNQQTNQNQPTSPKINQTNATNRTKTQKKTNKPEKILDLSPVQLTVRVNPVWTQSSFLHSDLSQAVSMLDSTVECTVVWVQRMYLCTSP